MNKGVVIHLDNDFNNVLLPAKNLFDQLNFDLDYIICKSKEEFDLALNQHSGKIKGLIFDLFSEEPSKEEIDRENGEFLEKIKLGFAVYNIPIFIFSGYLEGLPNEYVNYGTVFVVDKDQQDGQMFIFEKFKLLYDSGFIDVFCPGGILETEIKVELNKAFTKQFTKNSHIEEVVNSILKSDNNTEDKTKRVKNVFKRIAIKSLASDLLAPVVDSEDNVHPIEHFYRRQSKLKIWTGDIWKEKKDNKYVVVLTPRCDLAVGKAAYIMFCNIESVPPFNVNEKPEKLLKRLRDYLVDNMAGKATRYIPSNIFFPEGGMINLASHLTMQKEQFIQEYDYVITLSDDLTNEIIGKFAYYFLRTGITNINEREFEAIIRAMNTKTNEEK